MSTAASASGRQKTASRCTSSPGWRAARRSRAARIVAPVRQASSTSSTGPSGGAAPGARSASRSATGRPVCSPISAAGSRPLSGIATTRATAGSRQRLWLTTRASSATVLKSVTATIVPCPALPALASCAV